MSKDSSKDRFFSIVRYLAVGTVAGALASAAYFIPDGRVYFHSASHTAYITSSVILFLLTLLFALRRRKLVLQRAVPVMIAVILAGIIIFNLIDLPMRLFHFGNYPLKRHRSLSLIDLSQNDPHRKIGSEAHTLYKLREHIAGATILSEDGIQIASSQWKEYARISLIKRIHKSTLSAYRLLNKPCDIQLMLPLSDTLLLRAYIPQVPAKTFLLRFAPEEQDVLELIPIETKEKQP